MLILACLSDQQVCEMQYFPDYGYMCMNYPNQTTCFENNVTSITIANIYLSRDTAPSLPLNLTKSSPLPLTIKNSTFNMSGAIPTHHIKIEKGDYGRVGIIFYERKKPVQVSDNSIFDSIIFIIVCCALVLLGSRMRWYETQLRSSVYWQGKCVQCGSPRPGKKFKWRGKPALRCKCGNETLVRI